MNDNELLQHLIEEMTAEINVKYMIKNKRNTTVESFIDDVEKIKRSYRDQAIDTFLSKYDVYKIMTIYKYIETIANKCRDELLLSE